jgi:Hypoxanthine-guanine phosphoribosyltransferase
MNKEALKLLISPSDIASKVSELAKQILKDHGEEELILIGTLKGSFIFLADLVRALDKKDVLIDFVRVKSYGYSDTSSEEIVITKDVELPLEGKTVILVEDIVDTGLTVKFLLEHIKLHKPKSSKFAPLLIKGRGERLMCP